MVPLQAVQSWGNAVGLGLIALQHFFKIIPLDATSYYVDYVPVAFTWEWFALINVGMAVIGVAMMALPSRTARESQTI